MAIYHWVITVLLNLVLGTKDVKVYSDAGATTLFDQFNLTFDAGKTFEETIYLKNNGSDPVTVNFRTQGDTTGLIVTFTPNSMTLNGGEIQPLLIDIVALPVATIGSHNFSIIIYE